MTRGGGGLGERGTLCDSWVSASGWGGVGRGAIGGGGGTPDGRPAGNGGGGPDSSSAGPSGLSSELCRGGGGGMDAQISGGIIDSGVGWTGGTGR